MKNTILFGFASALTLLPALYAASPVSPSSLAMPQAPQRHLESPAERSVSDAIRRQIDRERSFSKGAREIDIITQDGIVILAGTVGSEAEKHRLQEIASKVQGVSEVDNQIQVKVNKLRH